MRKKALILGISGQDGVYLTKILIRKKVTIHGISRKQLDWQKNLREINIPLKQIKVFKQNKNYSSLKKILNKNIYDYIIFVGGQSRPKDSFDKLEYQTFDSVIEPLKILLEFIRKQKKKSKLIFSASSEIFGQSKKLINENTEKKPLSPYGLSKLIGLELVKSYRETFKLPVFSIIFFNHESRLRPDDFVIKKISNYFKYKFYLKNIKLQIGNINIKRDWGWAPEYMEIFYKIIKSKKIIDVIVATGKTTSLKKILEYEFKKRKLDFKKFIVTKENLIRKKDILENYANISLLKKKFRTFPRISHNDLIKKISY